MKMDEIQYLKLVNASLNSPYNLSTSEYLMS